MLFVGAVLPLLLAQAGAAAAPPLLPPEAPFAPAHAADHVATMEVRTGSRFPISDHGSLVIRSGPRIREERLARTESEVHFSDFSTGFSFSILRDPEGAIQHLRIERFPASDARHAYRRTRTGRADTPAGLACDIWIVPNANGSGGEEVCETEDGIQLWRGAGDPHRVVTASFARRQVRPEEVRPPRDFMRLIPWTNALGRASPDGDYEIRMTPEPGSAGGATELLFRRHGGTSYGRSAFADGLRTYWLRNDAALIVYSEEADGRPLIFDVTRIPNSLITLLADNWAPVPGRRPERVLGERCTWQVYTSVMNDPNRSCRTADGIPLKTEQQREGDSSKVDVYVARSLSRRPLADADFALPARIFDWAAWERAPAP